MSQIPSINAINEMIATHIPTQVPVPIPASGVGVDVAVGVGVTAGVRLGVGVVDSPLGTYVSEPIIIGS